MEPEGAAVAGLSAAGQLDDSGSWAETLRGRGNAREEAVLRLRAHLTATALFELRRRRLTGEGVRKEESARLLRDAAETALAAVLADLGRYHGQSAFSTWTAKYAIHEAAAVARARTIASDRRRSA
jgi:hypothetical protein